MFPSTFYISVADLVIVSSWNVIILLYLNKSLAYNSYVDNKISHSWS
jgi:hypothetical protein